MPPVGQVTASLFTWDLLEELSWLLFITSLYIYPHRVNRAHLDLPRFVLAALSPVVMNKTSSDGPHPSLLILFPWGSNLSPDASVASPTGPQPFAHSQHDSSAFTALSSSSPPPPACRSWFNRQQPQYKRATAGWGQLKAICEGKKELTLP